MENDMIDKIKSFTLTSYIFNPTLIKEINDLPEPLKL